jgi:hypothetical protein
MCYKETRKGEKWNGEEIKQETERHTQGADPATQADTFVRVMHNFKRMCSFCPLHLKVTLHLMQTNAHHLFIAQTRLDTE